MVEVKQNVKKKNNLKKQH